MKQAMLSMVMALALAGLVGCDGSDVLTVEWEFHNHTQHTMTFSPSGDDQDWTTFVLAPGDTHSLSISGDLEYTYTPSAGIARRQDGLKLYFE